MNEPKCAENDCAFPCGRSACINSDAAAGAGTTPGTNDCTSPTNLCPFKPDGVTREASCGSADRTAAVACRSSLAGECFYMITFCANPAYNYLTRSPTLFCPPDLPLPGGDAHTFEYRVQPMQTGAAYVLYYRYILNEFC